MPYTIIISEEAELDILEIRKYWEEHEHTVGYTEKLIGKINSVINGLGRHDEDFLQELSSKPDFLQERAGDYIVFYRVTQRCIIVHRVLHKRRDWMNII